MANPDTRKELLKKFIVETIFQQDGYVSTMVMFLILLGFGISASLGKWIITKYTILPLCESVFIVYKLLGCLFIILIFCLPDIFVGSPTSESSDSAAGVLAEETKNKDKTSDSGVSSNRSTPVHDANQGTEGHLPSSDINAPSTSSENPIMPAGRTGSQSSNHIPSIEIRNDAHNVLRTTTSNYNSLGGVDHMIRISTSNGKTQSRSVNTCQRFKDNIPLAGVLFFVVLVCFVNILEIFPRLDCVDEYKSVMDIDHTNSTSSMYMKSMLHVGNLVTWAIFAVMLTLFCCKIIYQEEHLYKFWPVRLGLVHLLATLLSVWCNYQLRESSDALEGSSYLDKDDNCAMITHNNITKSLNDETIECLCQNTSMFMALEHNASDYILPVNVEFCLLVAESIVHILMSLKPKKKSDSVTKGKSGSSVESSSTDAGHGSELTQQQQQELQRFDTFQEGQNHNETQPLISEDTNHRRETVLDVIMYIVSFLMSIIYLVLKIIKALKIGGKRSDLWENFYNGYLIIFWFVAIVVSIWGLVLVLKKFKFKSANKHTGFETLMILSAFGFYLHASLTLIAAVSTRIHEPNNRINVDMLIATTALDSIQIFLQIILMFKISGKASVLANSYNVAPHGHLKCVIIFFIVINFILWIVDSFIERKSSSEMDAIQMEFYGKRAWVIIYHVTYPLILYFRFNSFLHLLQSALKIYF